MSAELKTAFDNITEIVEAAKADRERFGNIAATIRINALRNGATTDEAEAMVRGEIDFIKWVRAKVEANTAQPEHDPQSCLEADGCPTENAVLKRFWRENRTRTDLSQAAVAAALEAAAKEHDAEIVRLEAQIIENKNYLRLAGKSERSSANDFCDAAIGHHRGSAARLRALITPAQHDALAAQVAAEVAKARAEDAGLLDASDEVKAYLDGVIGVVEANSFESMCLWMQAKDSARSWISTGHGYGPMIGRINNLPVCLSILTANVDGHKIVFIDATSEVSDWKLIDAWLQKNLPQSAMHEDGRVNKTDAMNFSNVFPRAQIGAKP